MTQRHIKTSVNDTKLYQLECDCGHLTAWYSTLERAFELLVNHQSITHKTKI